jgi:POT family proton-dependent oligopeptide transporter
MLAVFSLFLKANFGLDAGVASVIYSTFLGLVYFMPLFGGVLADKFGYGKMVTIGISIMFLGYLLLSLPLGGDTVAMVAMLGSLLFIAVGTGLFKGNLQVMVGNLYDDPKYSSKRDSAFSLFYMAINIGALFAPTAAVKIKEWAEKDLGFSGNDAYHFSFAVACVALIVSMIIYFACRNWYRHVEGGKNNKAAAAKVEDNLTPAETKARIVALCLVFAVVIFFWMAFHQNGLTLTFFADEFNETSVAGLSTMLFDVWNLVLIIVAVYATFSVFQSNSAKGKLLSGLVGSGVLAFLVYRATGVQAGATVGVDAPIFQQFNPFYVVALTPVSMAIFGALANKGKEPSAPRKIAYGMLVAALGFVVMVVGSRGLNTPTEQQSSIVVEKSEKLAIDMHKAQGNDKALEKVKKDKEAFEKKLNDAIKDAEKDEDTKKIAESKKLLALYNEVYDANTTILTTTVPEVVNTPEAPLTEEALAAANAAANEAKEKIATAEKDLAEIKANTKPATRVSSYWLILTYLILTFAELLLSPMGISFVTKVAPPKYKGLMMGGWFVATAIGNFLVAVGGLLWGGIPLTIVWSVFVVLCLLSALFMFVMMKRLESATK